MGKWLKKQQDKVDKAKAKIQRLRERQWNKKNKHRVPASYQEGDWVLVHHSRVPAWPRSTSDDPYFEPYKILSVDDHRITVRCSPVRAANPHLLRLSQICPRLATSWPFYTLRRYRRTPDHSQGLNYIILTCRIQRRCPFIVNQPRSDDFPGIAICRWCACATQISHTFFQNRIYINLFRQIRTLRCICVHPH